MVFQRIYLDSNVIIRAFEAGPEDAIAQDIVGIIGLIKLGEPARCVTNHITLAEVLVHPTRDGDNFLTQRYLSLLSTTTPWLHIQRVDQAVLVKASQLRAHLKLKLPDAIHAASAILTNCSHILSEDIDFHSRPSAPNLTLPTAIRPERQTLDRIIAWLRA